MGTLSEGGPFDPSGRQEVGKRERLLRSESVRLVVTIRQKRQDLGKYAGF